MRETGEGLEVLLRTGVTDGAAAERKRTILGGRLIPIVVGLTGD
ncbi:hypothetical protein AB0L05_04590 [Nonomuraea pusilla]